MTDKIFKLLINLTDEIKEYMDLHNWTIVIEGSSDFRGTTIATLTRCEYTYYNAVIKFNTNIYKGEYTYEEIVELFIHEVCHIFTGAGSNWLGEDVNESNMTNYIGRMQYSMIQNEVINQEESNTNILDKVVMKGFSLTKGYKELKKDYLLIIK